MRGTLVTGLTDGDLWRLDIFEGAEYARRSVRVRVLVQGGEGVGDVAQREEDNVEADEVEAQTYVWIAGAQRLEAAEWDFAEFVRDKMGRWVGGEAGDVDEGFQGRPSIDGVCFTCFDDGEDYVAWLADTHTADVDDAVAATQDPTGGRGANGSIARRLEDTATE